MATLSPIKESSTVTSLTSVRRQRLDVQLRQLEFHAMLHRKLELEHLFEALVAEGQGFVRFDGVRFAAPGDDGGDVSIGRNGRHHQRFALKLGERSLGEVVLVRETPFDAREERAAERLVEALVYPLDNALRHRAALLAAMTDRATGLRNQQCLERELPRELRTARRLGRPLALLHVSVDYLESISECHGTEAGELAWSAVAETLTGSLRRSDLIFRTDQDTFCILLADATLADAEGLAERLRRGIDRCVTLDNVRFVLTASGGLTGLGPDDTAGSLLARAAHALGRARQAGRNRVVVVEAPGTEDAPDDDGPRAA